MRAITLAACSLLAGCATTIHVEGVLVQGDRQYITAEDVRQALAAMRADSPELRRHTLREIYVNGPDRIWFTFTSDRSPHPVEKIHGRWKPNHGVWLLDLTNRWSQPLAVVMRTFDFIKRFPEFAMLAPASGGSASSR